MTVPAAVIDAAYIATVSAAGAAILTDTYAEFGYAALITVFVWHTTDYLGATVFTAAFLLLMFALARQLGDVAEMVGKQLSEVDVDWQILAVVADALLSDDTSTRNDPDP